MTKKKEKAIIEAILFSLGEAVDPERIADCLEDSVDNVKTLIGEMQEEWEAEDRGVTITEINGLYQMCSKKEMYDYLIGMTKSDHKSVLSDSALETLSIIAYKQPVTKLDIEKIRGVSCDHVVNRLLEFDLVKELGRMDAPGKPILFGTTEQFLRSFGVKSLDELPEMSTVQLEEFREQAEAEVQLKLDI